MYIYCLLFFLWSPCKAFTSTSRLPIIYIYIHWIFIFPNIHIYIPNISNRKSILHQVPRTIQLSQPLLLWQMLQSLIHLCGFLQYFGSVCPHLYCTAKSTTGHSSLEVVLPVPDREAGSLPSNVLPNTAQDSASLLATRVHCWFIFSLMTISTSWSSSAKLFNSGQSQLSLVSGVTLAFALPEVAVCPLLQPAQFLWLTAWSSNTSTTPPQSALFGKFLLCTLPHQPGHWWRHSCITPVPVLCTCHH